MKILYHIPFRLGLGADRWIFEGYKDASSSLRHDFYVFENHEKLEDKIAESSPEIFITSQNDLLLLGGDFMNILKNFRSRGGIVFVRVGEDFASTKQKIELIKNPSWCDIYFSSYSPQAMENFKEIVGREYFHIPFAANSSAYFPVSPSEKFKCDLCFVGGNLPKKRAQFEKILFPLFKKYQVRVFGPGWKFSDNFLSLLGKTSRKINLMKLAGAFYKQRVALSVNSERELYSSAKICLNIHEYDSLGQVLGLSNEREFKIPAAGGFQLSDSCPGLEYFFEPDKEIAIAENESDWFSKIEYYLNHEGERKKIQEAGTRRALRDHTYHQRVEQIIKIYHSL